jgi:hypothetical protein
VGGSGGGGGTWGSRAPEDIARELRELEQKTGADEYEAHTASYLASILADANDRRVEAIGTHLDEIKSALHKEVEGTIDLLFGGSVSKRTYVAGLSDVDALAVLNDSDLANKTPREVCDYILLRLHERFGFQTQVVADGFALTVKFSDISVQIVPVKRRGEELLLPHPDLNDWTRTRPSAFADVLRASNAANSGKVVPVIKLAKVILSQLPEGRPAGYHVEALAVEAFSNYQGRHTPKDMLHHFFEKSASLVLQPLTDRTGQSAAVDTGLGAANSLERLLLADRLGRIFRRIRNADGARNLGGWRQLFGDEP